MGNPSGMAIDKKCHTKITQITPIKGSENNNANGNMVPTSKPSINLNPKIAPQTKAAQSYLSSGIF